MFRFAARALEINEEQSSESSDENDSNDAENIGMFITCRPVRWGGVGEIEYAGVKISQIFIFFVFFVCNSYFLLLGIRTSSPACKI